MRSLPLLFAVTLASTATACSSEDAASDDAVSSEDALTSAQVSRCSSGAIGFSDDGHYALVERCGAGTRRIVRVDLTTHTDALVAVLAPGEMVGGFHDEGAAFSASVFSSGSGPSSELVADWALSRVEFRRGKWLATVDGGHSFYDWDSSAGGFFFGALAGAAPAPFVATGITGPTWHSSSRWMLLVSTDDPGTMRRFDTKTGTLGPVVQKPLGDPFSFGFAFDGEKVFTVEQDLQTELRATDAATGLETTLAVAGGRMGTETVFASEASPYVLYFASDAVGGPRFAHTIKKDKTGPQSYPTLPESRFVTIGVVGSRLTFSEIGGKRGLLDPQSGAVVDLASDAELVGKNFWSASTRTLTDGQTDAVLYAAPAPSDLLTTWRLAGDGRTVWEIRRSVCAEASDLKVLVHGAAGDQDLGCRPLLADSFVRVGATSSMAFVTSGGVKILSP